MPKTVDRRCIKNLLLERKYTGDQIAKKCNCGRRSVVRVAKELGLSPGKGIKNYWQYKTMIPELAYIIGTYLTDGSLLKSPNDRTKNRGFILSVVSKEFSKKVESCLYICNLKNNVFYVQPKEENHKQKRSVVTYTKMFADWLETICDGKEHIPKEIQTANIEIRFSFLAAVIDGDGRVRKDGSINVRGVHEKYGWINDLPEFLGGLQIRTKIRTDKTQRGEPYRSVSINRSDFRSLGGWVIIPEKMNRVLYGKEERTKRKRKKYEYICPECGEKRMTNKDAKSCRDCYLKSERFHDHLKNIAPKGNRAGNIARWGTNHLHR